MHPTDISLFSDNIIFDALNYTIMMTLVNAELHVIQNIVKLAMPMSCGSVLPPTRKSIRF